MIDFLHLSKGHNNLVSAMVIRRKALFAYQCFSILLLLAAILTGPTTEMLGNTSAQERPRTSSRTFFDAFPEPTPNPTRKAAKPYSSKPSKDALKWADKQLESMSLDEKIG